MSKINDLDLENWKEYGDILTDSLWILGERDKSGAHNNVYHGNFIPQIPNQMMRRFTKKGDVVLDAFLGHGTTLIESKRLGRHGIGLELMPEVARAASNNIRKDSLTGRLVDDGKLLAGHNDVPAGNEDSPDGHHTANNVHTKVIVADSTSVAARVKVEEALGEIGQEHLHLIILHPPYHDIIKFSNKKEDLCNATTVQDFADKFGDVIENFYDLLAPQRHIAIVIGDAYKNSEWVPLGFYLMHQTLNRVSNLKLKSIVVKNMSGNRAKINQQSLWRYRALVGGFYIFKHEYIFVFKKIK